MTRHNHNNYEHNVIKKYINIERTLIPMILKKIITARKITVRRIITSNGNLNFRKIENISLSQQTDITNNVIETNNQTTTYVDNNYLNNNKIATTIINPTPSLTENYLWIPEVNGNVVPGLDSLITHLNQKFASLITLQSSITNINNTINNEIQNLQTEINNIEITSSTGNVSKESHYHTSHTNFTYQRNNTKNYNRRQFVIQNHYFTYQRKTNHELQIQALNIIVADLQNQTNNLSSGSGGGGDPDGTDTMYFIGFLFILYIYIQICRN